MSSGGLKSIKQPLGDGGATKPCRVCGEGIKRVAVKCIHCNGWQDWRSGLAPIGTTILPLLIALVSVSLASLPTLTSLLTPKRSVIAVALQHTFDNQLSAIASNSGARPGSINAATVFMGPPDKFGENWLFFFKPSESGAVIVPPGESRLIQFSLVSLDTPHGYNLGVKAPLDPDTWHSLLQTTNRYKNERDSCAIVFAFSNFDGSGGHLASRFNCTTVLPFLFGLSHRE